MNELALRHEPTHSVPRMLAQSLTELPFGSQTQIRVQEGQLSAFLAYAGYDKHVGTVKYALRVLNNTAVPAYARLFVDLHGTQISAYPCDIEIAPFSMRDDVIPVRMDVTGRFDRAIVAISAEDHYFTVEAPPPPRGRPNWIKWCGLALIPVFVGGAAQVCTPRILDVSVPQKALAGTMLQVPFQVSGLGSVEYDFQTRDGLRLSAGLASKSGVLDLQIPRGGAGTPYTLYVRMRNAFRSTENVSTIGAVVPATVKAPVPDKPDALIQNLSVTPSPVVAGKSIAIRYSTTAQSGDVWLLDGSGATWAHAPLSVYGSTQLTVPQVAAGSQMRVVLHAQSGSSNAQSSVGITVMPSQKLAAQTSTETSSQTQQAARPAATAAAAAPSMTLSSQVVSPGDTVTATISGVQGDARISLMSAGGATLAQGDADDDSGVTLKAPSVSTPTTFFVVATLTTGVSQQSIVKRLVVTPR